jgi:hypothetical protein
MPTGISAFSWKDKSGCKPYGVYKEVTVALVDEGGVFGEPSLRPGGGHRDCAEALTDCG